MTRRLFAFVAIAALLAGAACGKSSSDAKLATGEVKRVIGFDLAAHQNSESLAVDDNGDIYITFPFLGKIERVKNGTTTPEAFASVPVEQGDFGTLGIAIDGDDVVVGVQSKKSNGIWRFSKSTGQGQRMAGTEAIGFPNDLVVDDGDLYVASSVDGKDAGGANLGAIWRVPKSGQPAKLLSSPQLGGTGSSGLPVPIGANGIALHDDTLFVGVTEQGQILRFHLDNGKLGAPAVYVKDAQINGADGITVDDAGNLFVAVIAQSQIVRVDKDDKAITKVATNDDGLDFASSVKFGKGKFDGDLLAVNFAVAELLGGKTVEGPALLRIPKA